jgi:hypothetical protein
MLSDAGGTPAAASSSVVIDLAVILIRATFQKKGLTKKPKEASNEKSKKTVVGQRLVSERWRRTKT